MSEAIQSAKAAKGIFVVVIHGDPSVDDQSSALLTILDSDDVKSRLSLTSTPPVVAIKILNGSTTCAQFSQVYPVVLVPSVYFIDSSSGLDLEVTGGEISNEKLSESINKAVSKMKPSSDSQPSVAASSSSAESITSPTAVRIEHARQTLNDAVPISSSNTTATSSETAGASALTLEERVAKAKELLAQRQAQKAKEEEEQQKAKERERRELGQTLSDLKRKREEEEMIKAAQERRKDKEEERLAREKIKAQIAQDRENRAARFDAVKQAELEAKSERERRMREQEAEEAQRLAAERSKSARVQFRFPDGRSKTKIFSSDAPLQEIYDFVNGEVGDGFGRDNFSLSTTYPARQLDLEPRTAELRVVGLAPSGTVMILPKNRSSGGALMPSGGSLLSYIWLILTPVSFLWNLITSFFTSTPATAQDGSGGGGRNDARSIAEQRARAAEKRQAETSTSAPSANKRPSTAYQRRTPAGGAGIRKEGNIARLGGDEDSDDESNTYNGNSTQQM